MKRCKYCGAFVHAVGCSNPTCINYVKPKQDEVAKKATKKSSAKKAEKVEG